MFYEVFKVGPITVHGYGLMIAIGLLAAILLADYRGKKQGLDGDLVFNLMIIAIITGFLGAKLLYLVVEFKAFLRDPFGLLLSGSGFVVYGGIIFGALSAFLYCKKKGISFLKHFDLFMPSIALAQGFGRIGCLGAGCCYGRETESIFHIIFHEANIAPINVPLVPTQIYSSISNFTIAAILLIYARKNKRPGNVGLLYLILYSVFRSVIEFFRADYRGSVGVLSTSQFISIFIFVGAIIAMIINNKRGLKDTDKEKEPKEKKQKEA
ncbi:MAG: prolipoprotein diacylglyceryl transferase [Eubacteriales bacterium]